MGAAFLLLSQLSLLIGELKFSETSRGGVFSFAYDNAFLTSDYRLQVDPQLTLHRGEFYNDAPDKNFRVTFK
ncbi:hypothetical protein AWR38_26710 [Idiomarina sp. WRN-38]|nr:hypothetical protein AUR68_26670 [Idiomarina sp. H105]OAF13283.1 hypothetical protein AWR38_26710 [Idiomarina sp. WRN-38]